jgi:hypothetical protein
MARHYSVRIVDADGNLILQFKGSVIKKEQGSGRSGLGDVDETLFVKNPKFKVTSLFKPRD